MGGRGDDGTQETKEIEETDIEETRKPENDGWQTEETEGHIRKCCIDTKASKNIKPHKRYTTLETNGENLSYRQ